MRFACKRTIFYNNLLIVLILNFIIKFSFFCISKYDYVFRRICFQCMCFTDGIRHISGICSCRCNRFCNYSCSYLSASWCLLLNQRSICCLMFDCVGSCCGLLPFCVNNTILCNLSCIIKCTLAFLIGIPSLEDITRFFRNKCFNLTITYNILSIIYRIYIFSVNKHYFIGNRIPFCIENQSFRHCVIAVIGFCELRIKIPAFKGSVTIWVIFRFF